MSDRVKREYVKERKVKDEHVADPMDKIHKQGRSTPKHRKSDDDNPTTPNAVVKR